MSWWSTASTARATVTTYSGETGSIEISSGFFVMGSSSVARVGRGKAPERMASGAFKIRRDSNPRHPT